MKLNDVMDIARLKGLLQSIEPAFGIPCALAGNEESVFSVLHPSLCALCDEHSPQESQDCREYEKRQQKKLLSGEPVIRECLLGLRCIAQPILVKGEFAGAIVVGPFLTRRLDEEALHNLAHDKDIPADTLQAILENQPVLAENRVQKLGAFCRELAETAAQLCLDSLRISELKTAMAEEGKALECEVTERTLELERTERRLNAAQRITETGSFERDLINGDGWWSDEVYRLLGYEPHEIESSQENFNRHIHPEDVNIFLKAMNDNLSRGEPFTIEFRLITHQDDLRWVYAQIDVDKDDFGTPIKYRGAFRDITRRKRIEDELRSVNRLQQLILDNSIIGIALVRHRRFEWVNQQAADMTGLPLEELMGSSTRVVYTDDEQYEYLGRTAYRAMSAGESYDAVFPFKHQTKGHTWCRFVATALNPEKPEDGSIWMFEDITERRAADIALRQSRQELESIFENSQVGIMFIRDGRILARGNQRLAKIFGYDSPEEMVNLSMRELHISDKAYHEFGQQYFNKLVYGEQTQIEYRLRRKDGSAVWCSLSGKAVDAQEPIDLDKGVIWVIEDITVRKKAEAALRLSERRFRAIFTHAGVGICTVDREGVMHRVNHRLCMLTGYEEYDLLGMNVKEIVHPDDFGQDAELRQRLWMRDIPMFVREQRFIRRDGKELWGRVTTTVVRADDKTPQYLLEVVEDITERKRLESELVRLARTDSLTGLKNRHYFMERGNEEFDRFKRYGTPMCAMLMDIDHFKNINDTYGHHLGDLVLKKLAATCEDILRKTDVFGRIGGEEFAMVLVELDLDTAHEIAERIRHEVENTVVATEEGDIRFTVSIGVTDLRTDDAKLEKTIQRADSLMYEAKQSGRNKVVKG